MKFFKKHDVVKNPPPVPEESKNAIEQRAYKKHKASPAPLPNDPPSVSQKLKDLAKLRQSRVSSTAIENIENSQNENL